MHYRQQICLGHVSQVSTEFSIDLTTLSQRPGADHPRSVQRRYSFRLDCTYSRDLLRRTRRYHDVVSKYVGRDIVYKFELTSLKVHFDRSRSRKCLRIGCSQRGVPSDTDVHPTILPWPSDDSDDCLSDDATCDRIFLAGHAFAVAVQCGYVSR